MNHSLFTVHRKVILIRQFKEIGITSKLKGYYIPTAQLLPARFYNGRITYQYKNLRVGLTTLRKQPRCYIELIVKKTALPF